MRNMLGLARSRTLFVLALAACLSLFVAACGDDDDDGGSGGSTTVKETVAASDCGPEAGKKATGSPIKLGALATKQPGTDFSEIPRMAEAYFKCVNDNGGINGHPVEYVIETEQTDPGQAASQAKKLIESEKVLGIAGNIEHHRVRRQPQVLRVEGLLRDRRRHRAQLLRDAEHRRR